MIEKTYGTFIVNPRGELLICRPYGIKTTYAWTIPKGKAESGETDVEAAIRECFEETGFDLKPFKKNMEFIGSQTYKTKKKRLFGYFLKLEVNISINTFFCDCKLVGKDVPEIDLYEWEVVNKALPRIHEAQSKLLQTYLADKKELYV